MNIIEIMIGTHVLCFIFHADSYSGLQNIPKIRYFHKLINFAHTSLRSTQVGGTRLVGPFNALMSPGLTALRIWCHFIGSILIISCVLDSESDNLTPNCPIARLLAGSCHKRYHFNLTSG